MSGHWGTCPTCGNLHAFLDGPAHPDGYSEPPEPLRLIDTKPQMGALTPDIEMELDSHNPGPNWRCDCGDQLADETYNRHVASMIDYRLTATDGDA